MRTMFNQIDDRIIHLVMNAEQIAVIGLSSQVHKPSHYAPRYLQDQGYRIIPVNINQHVDRILGEKVYRDLMSIPYDYDILQVFRPSAEIPVIVNNYFAAPHQAPLIWFQVGIHDQESFSRIEEAGFHCVMDRCLMAEHQKIMAQGGIPKAGGLG